MNNLLPVHKSSTIPRLCMILTSRVTYGMTNSIPMSYPSYGNLQQLHTSSLHKTIVAKSNSLTSLMSNNLTNMFTFLIATPTPFVVHVMIYSKLLDPLLPFKTYKNYINKYAEVLKIILDLKILSQFQKRYQTDNLFI